MDGMKALLGRRSIRQFTNRSIPNSIVEDLLRAAMAAPSAGNEQPWEFLVLTDRAILDAVPAIHPYCQMLRQAPLGILVCANLARDVYQGYYWVQDCAAAIENLLVAAHAMGLGAVWTGIYPGEQRVADFRAMFDLPEEVVPVAMIPVGYPAEDKPPANRYDASRIHSNRW